VGFKRENPTAALLQADLGRSIMGKIGGLIVGMSPADQWWPMGAFPGGMSPAGQFYATRE